MIRTVAFLAVVTLVVAQTTSRADAKIEDSDLPGLTFQTNFDQYAGYINLPGTTKNMFYWFFTSQNDDPTKDPVILWLQGGPGCSGLGDGLFMEHGPYYLNADANQTLTLVPNPYSWNKLANVIYIESPCGVGFSYGTNLPSDYVTNDNITAENTYLFLQSFFDIYTEFAGNEFWITGESYAGVYIPSLANQVLTNTSDSQLTANLKKGGLMLGNPVTNCDGLGEDYTGQGGLLNMNDKVQMFYWHGMVSRRNYDNWMQQSCNNGNPVGSVEDCQAIYAAIVSGVGKLDQPLANKRSDKERASSVPVGAINPDMLYYSYCTGNGTLDFNVASVPNCFGLDDQVDAYLNDPAVQAAIHAQVGTKWVECTDKIEYRKLGIPATNYLNSFFEIAPTMRILYYSGDCDLDTVPFGSTERCLVTMNRSIVSPWRPYVFGEEVSGYVQVYDTYTFATIKGAGHEAPQFQPAAAYLLFSSFLKNKSLPGAGI